jgi:predicted Rossmann-fold nucleotide-binding protein
MVITGAGGGIMEAAQRGAGRERSFGVNIRLPFEQAPNRFIDGDVKLLMFSYFFTRKLFFIKEAHAVALFPGGFGTLDEGFEVLTLLQTGKCQCAPRLARSTARNILAHLASLRAGAPVAAQVDLGRGSRALQGDR